MDPKQKAKSDLWMWLAQNKGAVAVLNMDMLVMQAKYGAGAAILTDAEIRSTIRDWMFLNNVKTPLLTPSTDEAADGPIKAAVKNEVKSVTDPVTVDRRVKGKVSIGIGGLTGELTKGSGSVGLTLGWGGKLQLDAAAGEFHFSGELSKDRWQVTLSYPDDTTVPNLTTLGKVFGEAEKAARDIAKASATFNNVNDISRIKGQLQPNLKPVKDAIEAVQGIAKASTGKPNISLQFGSPDPQPGQTGMPGGIQGQVVLTWVF